MEKLTQEDDQSIKPYNWSLTNLIVTNSVPIGKWFRLSHNADEPGCHCTRISKASCNICHVCRCIGIVSYLGVYLLFMNGKLGP